MRPEPYYMVFYRQAGRSHGFELVDPARVWADTHQQVSEWIADRPAYRHGDQFMVVGPFDKGTEKPHGRLFQIEKVSRCIEVPAS